MSYTRVSRDPGPHDAARPDYRGPGQPRVMSRFPVDITSKTVSGDSYQRYRAEVAAVGPGPPVRVPMFASRTATADVERSLFVDDRYSCFAGRLRSPMIVGNKQDSRQQNIISFTGSRDYNF